MPKRKRKSIEQKREEARINKQILRKNIAKRKHEQEADTARRRSARQNSEIRQIERETDSARRRSARQNPEIRQTEQGANSARRRSARQNPEIRQTEQGANSARRRSARQNPEIRQTEQVTNSARRRSARQNPEIRQIEQETDSARRRSARQNPEIRQIEQETDSARRRSARQNPEIRQIEQETDSTRRQSARQNPQIRMKEQNVNTSRRQTARRDPSRVKNRQAERASDSIRRKNFRKKQSTQFQRTPFETLKSEFEKVIRDAPTHVCSCCGGLFHSKGVRNITMKHLQNQKFSADFIENVIVLRNDDMKLCRTCYLTIQKLKVPKLCLSNGHDFPLLPEELKDLSPLEERLVALRIPFMQIRSVGVESQSKLKGNVINVENDLDVCARVIPRRFTELSTIQVQLMRRMQYNRPYMYETIRPAKVYKASMFLKQTELYEINHVGVRNDWADFDEGCSIEFISEEQNETGDRNESNQDACEGTRNDSDDEDEETDISSALLDETLIYNECDYRLQGIRLAPGEDRIPIPLYDDPYCEEMAFPSIYAGQIKMFKPEAKITYTDRAKSEIRNRDRRACIPQKILYMFRRSYNEKMRQAVQVHLRKRQKSESITASQARDPVFLQNLVSHDEGYAVWKTLRSSPSYWQAKSKKVLGMIRQLGKCSIFLTMSAAETRWPELLVALYRVLKGVDITQQEALELPADVKADLIRSDPVTCMRHFDHRTKEFKKWILQSKNGVFCPYQLTDHFSRIEFQMRGSPHSHGLYWVKDAPIYDENDTSSEDACVTFIDQFITCARDESDDMKDLLQYQIHKHSMTCKKGKQDCRFGFPRPPLPKTMILKPLPSDLDANVRKNLERLYSNTQKYLSELGRNPEKITFVSLIDKLNTNENEYIQAVRSSISRATVFLKRNTDEAFINSYNKKVLQTWRANIDIQFVLDTYACAKYCVGYITKSEGGISKLLQEITKQARKETLTCKEKLRRYASALINGTEISAQEASAFLLGLPNTSCSRQDIFVNSSPPESRIRILRSQEELETLDEDCQDICAAGIVEHYENRPRELEDCCLAEFATMYEYKKSTKRTEDTDDCLTDASQSSQPSTNYTPLLNGSGFVRKRIIRKILRFRNYGKSQDPENWAREQLMLFTPFRNEDEEINAINIAEKIAKPETQEVVLKNSASFYHNRNLDDISLQDMFHSIENLVQVDDADYENYEENEIDNAFLVDSMIGPSDKRKVENFMPPKACSEEEYLGIMRNLNEKQRKFVLNVLHLLKTKKDQFCYFLSGGAGTGKSHVITAIVQSGLRHFALRPTEHPEQFPIVVAAPTGKAAFNVFGMTLHCLFRLPPTQSNKKLADLDEGTANTLRNLLGSCKLIIIDEVSMVSVRQLYHIDQRLKQIFRDNSDFGGISMLVVGHMRQLAPIGGSHVFRNPAHTPLGEVLGNPLWERFFLFELDEIMRQKGDWEFCRALNNMSEGVMDEQDISLIRSRKITESNIPPKDAIWLFRTNQECAEYNARIHAELEGIGFLSIAIDKIQGSGSDHQKNTLLEAAKHFTLQESDGLPYKTYLKIGGEYFISTNIDVEDGLFNGATGTLKFIETIVINSETKVRRVWMSFHHSSIGLKARKEAQPLYTRPNGPAIDTNWVPVGYFKRKLSKTYQQHSLSIVRNQIPLIPCNGMTIAKSQGSSMQNVVVSVKGRRTIRREELYVACSRATSKQGLFIDGEFCPPSKPSASDPVTIEIERLRSLSFPFRLKFLQSYGPQFLKVYFHNIQSFKKHAKDIQADHCAISADILCILEPWLLASDTSEIPGFKLVHRVNCTRARNSEGVLIFCKANIDLRVTDWKADIHEDNSHCFAISFFCRDIQFVVSYKSPAYSERNFKEMLSSVLVKMKERTIVLGDFNLDVTKQLRSYFNERGLDLKILDSSITTNHNTTIDGCFSSMDEVECWVFESYYSYHKPLCAVTKTD